MFHAYLDGKSIISPANDCSCNDYLNVEGYGRCLKLQDVGMLSNGRPYCFVNEPSTCSDLNFSNISRKRTSYDACLRFTGIVKFQND